MTTKRVPLHRVRHQPEFLAEVLVAPLGPSPFAPLRLPAAFECDWTPVLSRNCLRLVFNSTPSFLHGYIRGGDGYGARWAARLGYEVTEVFWALIAHRVIARISSCRARIGAESPATSALLRLLPSSNWLAGCYRHWDRRAGCEGERRVAVRGFLERTIFLRVLLLFPKGSNSCPS